MGRAYSANLRERVLRTHERGEGSQRVLAERFGVATGTVSLWLPPRARVVADRACTGAGARRRVGPTRPCWPRWWTRPMTCP